MGFGGLTGLACGESRPPSAGCAKDVDCKGTRICRDAVCIEPPAEDLASARGDAAGDSAKALDGADAAAGGPRPHRGGPAPLGPLTMVGPKTDPTPQWEVALGAPIVASALLVDREAVQVAFVGTHAGRFVGVTTAASGSTPAGSIVIDVPIGGRIWSTAAQLQDGSVVVGSDDDVLVAIDPAAGTERWRVKLGSCAATRAPGPEGARCDVDGGPTVGDDGDVYVGSDGVYRLRPDGTMIWKWPATVERPSHVYSSPVLDRRDGLVVGAQDGWVTRLRRSDGAESWRYKIGADVDGTAAILSDDTVVIGADDGRVHAIRSDGSLRWSFLAQRDIRSAIALGLDDEIFATSHDGNLYAIAASGEVRWVFGTQAPIQSSPVVDAEGRVYFGGQDGFVYALERDGTLAWRHEVGVDVDAAVAITREGALIFGADDGKLRAIR
jgi:outer membrane protein assembly factor BamB